MNRTPRSLVLLLLLVPLTGLGQSYEWVDRFQPPNNPTRFPPTVTGMSASGYGLYSISFTNCYTGQSPCESWLSKNRPEDGKRFWRRKVSLGPYGPYGPYTLATELTVNAHGVFVSGHLTPYGAGAFLARYSHEGDLIWIKEDTGSSIQGLESDADGLYVVGTYGQHSVLRQLNFDGEEVWTRTGTSWVPDAANLVLGDGQLFFTTLDNNIEVYRTNGAFVRHLDISQLEIDARSGPPRIAYHDGYLYLRGRYDVVKMRADGVESWTVRFNFRLNGIENVDTGEFTVGDDGVFLLGDTARWATPNSWYLYTGRALIHLSLDGTIVEVTEFPGQTSSVAYHARLDGENYLGGNTFTSHFAFSFVGRLSDRVLIPRSLRVLAGRDAGAPPRLAALDHDFGIGPVRVGIKDVTGGDETQFRFSEGLKPVSFDVIGDLNGNGHQELVVVSRLPALAEVRDSLDGSLVSIIKLGNRFDPITATVVHPEGASPRLAVLVRNETANRTLLTEYDLSTGDLLASIFYNPNYEPLDVFALPQSGSGYAYAVLARDPMDDAPSKVEIRSASAGLVDNFWIMPEMTPIELSPAGDGSDFAVLRYDSVPERPSVRQIDADTGTSATVRYVFEQYRPVKLLVVPDTDGNGHAQLAVLGEHMHFRNNKVRVEMRDAVTGLMNYRIDLDPLYRPSDAAYVGAVPGYSNSAMAFTMRLGTEPWINVVIVDAATGSELYTVGLLE